jgi:hypothetical protein
MAFAHSQAVLYKVSCRRACRPCTTAGRCPTHAVTGPGCGANPIATSHRINGNADAVLGSNASPRP